ncbi:hypothetical protein APY03_0415 [Variovorax sp. WDL1]|nr:hypothetical protein APY03_0415 [Variovorax sp. WDL1]
MLKREAQASFKMDNPVTLYLSAFACDEFGEAPRWAKVTLDQAFMDQLLAMRTRCIEQNLDLQATSAEPEAWQEDGMFPRRVSGTAVYVNKGGWWFQGYPKHCNYAIETRMVEIETLLTVLKTRTSSEYLAWHGDVLVYETAGDMQPFVESLIEEGELEELTPDR